MGFLDKVIKWARLKSPWILHLNTGGCNACDIEILAALMPRFDVERFGVLLMGSPRHADVLVCTGPITKQMKARFKKLYEQVPDPKFVMAVGNCACTGGVFKGCYGVEGGIDTVVPVDVYVPGCPPKPEAIIDGVAKLLAKIQKL